MQRLGEIFEFEVFADGCIDLKVGETILAIHAQNSIEERLKALGLNLQAEGKPSIVATFILGDIKEMPSQLGARYTRLETYATARLYLEA
jgi:hypothetical protein